MVHGVNASKLFRSLAGLALAVSLAAPTVASAQSANVQALGLVRDAMDAYSNLDLDTAKQKLDEAVALAPQLDKATLARIYVSYGVLHIGGFTDNAKGQQNFIIALCLDDSILVDPLLSTPEIDMLFTMAKNQVNPGQCQQTLSTITMPGGGGGQTGGGGPTATPPKPQIPPCGQHQSPVEQRQKHELPVYLELATQMHGRVNRLVLKYAFDGSQSYNEMPLRQAGRGYGAQITCDEGQIRVFDPSSISYFIEGYDRMGNRVCGHGSAEAPLVVAMTPDAPVLPAVPGFDPPKECAPCPPWDDTCRDAGLPGLDEPCDPSTGCASGLVCGDAFLCVPEAAGGGGAGGAPSRFYVNLGAGTGAGFMSTEMKFDKTVEDEDTGEYRIESVDDNPSGMAWNGIALRPTVGVYLIENLALEVSARVDLKIDTFSEPVSCLDAAEDAGLDVDQIDCLGGTPEDDEAAASAVALKDGGGAVESKETLFAWLVNLRVRYDIVAESAMRLGIFGGVGYGHIKYRVAAADKPFFPLVGMVDIELGANFFYYFSKNYGIGVEVPIDVLVGDGFALDFELILIPVSVGF